MLLPQYWKQVFIVIFLFVLDISNTIVENALGKTISGFSNETERLCLEAAQKELKLYYSFLANVEIVMEGYQRNNKKTGDMRSLYSNNYHFLLTKIFK